MLKTPGISCSGRFFLDLQGFCLNGARRRKLPGKLSATLGCPERPRLSLLFGHFPLQCDVSRLPGKRRPCGRRGTGKRTGVSVESSRVRDGGISERRSTARAGTGMRSDRAAGARRPVRIVALPVGSAGWVEPATANARVSTHHKERRRPCGMFPQRAASTTSYEQVRNH